MVEMSQTFIVENEPNIYGRNEPNIYIVDKSIRFGKNVSSDLEKRIGPTSKSTPDAFWRHKN